MATDPNSGLPRPTPEQQQAWAERYEREFSHAWPGVNGLQGNNSDTVLALGCGPSLNGVDWPTRVDAVCSNNSAIWAERQESVHPLCSVFIDTERFVEMAPQCPGLVASMFCPAKPVKLLEQWFDTAEALGDRFIPIRSTGQNGRLSNIDNGGDVSRGIPVMAGSVIYTTIQFAALLARKNVVILGVDMEWNGTQNHWDGVDRYVKKGAHDLWERTGRAAMIKLRDRLAADGIRLLKGTPGGKVDVLEDWHG